MRPPAIVNFERIVLLAILLEIIETIVVWDRLSSADAASEMGGESVITFYTVAIAGYLLLIWFISRKASVVAKWIYVVLTVLGLAIGITEMGQVADVHATLWLISAIVQFGLALLSIWLLFRPDANAWFRGKRPADPGVFS